VRCSAGRHELAGHVAKKRYGIEVFAHPSAMVLPAFATRYPVSPQTFVRRCLFWGLAWFDLAAGPTPLRRRNRQRRPAQR
jgi:hypothetical protein